jgi:membrane peptidoglycan carboxypeptidase
MASSFVGYTPSMMNVWAIWNPDDKGNPQVVPAFSGYGVSSTGYPAHLFQEFMAQALQGTEAEQFPTAKDNGKIGLGQGTEQRPVQQHQQAVHRRRAEAG